MPGVEDLANTIVETTDAQNGKDTYVTLRLEASESQPNRVCEITLALTSEGDEASRSTTFELEAMAVDEQDSSSTSTETGDSDDGGSLSQESNTLPWVGGVELLILLSTVAVRRANSSKD
jgi:hypothetical protein